MMLSSRGTLNIYLEGAFTKLICQFDLKKILVLLRAFYIEYDTYYLIDSITLYLKCRQITSPMMRWIQINSYLNKFKLNLNPKQTIQD